MLLLRGSYGLIALGVAAPSISRYTPHSLILGALAATLLLAGLWTRPAATLLAIGIAIELLLRAGIDLLLLGHLGGSAALALLGPGAFSVDAHRFGRHVMQFHTPPDRGRGA